jgi:hypothetical protein
MSSSSEKEIKQDQLDDYLENKYSYKELWQKSCSTYFSSSDNIKQISILPAVKRIIVLGDIHGDLEMAYSLLRVANLIDESNEWIGGETIVVQVGDQVDRCRYKGNPCNNKGATLDDEGNDWEILQYFTKLHNMALKVGGAVYSLIGNHELMNVDQDLRYVSYEGIKEFSKLKIENDEKTNKQTIKPTHKKFSDEEEMIEYGKKTRLEAFAPGNPVSEFLACTRQIAIIIGSNLFVHAGILPKIAKKYSVSNLNKLLSLYLFGEISKSEYKDIFVSPEFSPLWNRKIGNMGINKYKYDKKYQDNDEKCNNILRPLKEIYKVDRLYVGHTPLLKHGIGSVCDEHIWFTDFGASRDFDKYDDSISESSEPKERSRKAQVLEIINDGEVIRILK